MPRTMRSVLIGAAALCVTHTAAAADISGKVTAANGELHDVYVYADGPPSGAPANPNAAPLQAMAQKANKFSPEVLVTVAGSTLDFPNQDKLYHNVFSLTPGNEFDLGLYRGGESKTNQMQQPGEVDVYCNIHPQMTGKVLVVPNASYTQVQADGSFKLTGLPAGKVTLVAWSPTHTPSKQQVEVHADAAVHVNFVLRPRSAAGTHLNKNGEQYGRYK